MTKKRNENEEIETILAPRDLLKILFVGMASMYVAYMLLYGYALWSVFPALVASAVIGFVMAEVAARLVVPIPVKRNKKSD